MDKYDIAFCVNNAYIQYICVTIVSIITNNPGKVIHFHILVDAIKQEEQKRLNDILKDKPDTSLSIIKVQPDMLPSLPQKAWPKYAWYRLLLPVVLPESINKVLYLDADTLVVGDISGLFNLKMDNIAIAGVIDPLNFDEITFERCNYYSKSQYICSGVLLMNLSYWRAHNLTAEIIKYAKKHADTIMFPDQDSINVLCKNNKLILPLKYGIQGSFFTKDNFYSKEYLKELKDCIFCPVIIHYAGQAPWKKEWANHYYQKTWEDYNKKLKYPAKRYWITKGWPFVKMLVWNVIHPFEWNSKIPSSDVILQKLEEASKNDS